ncbi:MAG TPA: hypothetical protein DCP08_01385 [Chloroflexi bacterium]|nr:hypothetical protein [Chloroflexota bacterium]
MDALPSRIPVGLAYYVDQHSILRFVEHQGVHVSYRLRQDQGRVQFRRALEELGIGIIYAHSPEAKGKIEKRFDYFQRPFPISVRGTRSLISRKPIASCGKR